MGSKYIFHLELLFLSVGPSVIRGKNKYLPVCVYIFLKMLKNFDSYIDIPINNLVFSSFLRTIVHN